MYTNWEQLDDGSGGCFPPEALNIDGSLPAPFKTGCDLGAMSTYSVNATSAAEIAHTVKFAAKHNLRFRIKNVSLFFLNGNAALRSRAHLSSLATATPVDPQEKARSLSGLTTSPTLL